MKIDFTDAAAADLQAQVDDNVKLVDLQALAALAEGAGKATIATTPGLWYTVCASGDLTTLAPATCELATGATLEVWFPRQEGARGFYAIGVSACQVEPV